MKPSSYIWLGIGCGALAVVVLLMAHSNDALESSIAQTELALGHEVSGGGDGDLLANLAALALFAASGVLILIGAVGAGVRAGVKRD